MSQPIAIIGDGQMGLVLAQTLAEAGACVRLWGPFPDEVRALAATRESRRLPGFRLDRRVEVEASSACAFRDAGMTIDAIPTQHIRSVWSRFPADVPPGSIIVSVSKGIEQQTLLRPLQVVADALGESIGLSDRPMVCLSGPTIAAELVRRLPATMVAASFDANAAEQVQETFGTPWLRIYTNDDVVGVEVAGAVKNVIAIAAGIVDGMRLGCNAKSALLARGLAEVARLGVAMGARRDTFFGVAGVGDLATTCFSPEGRNRSCGESLGRGVSLDDHLKSIPSVVEGVDTTRSVVALAQRFDVEMPIAQAVHDILFDGLAPRDAIAALMEREQKPEHIG